MLIKKQTKKKLKKYNKHNLKQKIICETELKLLIELIRILVLNKLISSLLHIKRFTAIKQILNYMYVGI